MQIFKGSAMVESIDVFSFGASVETTIKDWQTYC